MYQIEFFSSQKFEYNKKRLIFGIEEITSFVKDTIEDFQQSNHEGLELLKHYLQTIQKEKKNNNFAFTYMNLGIFKVSKMKIISTKELVNQTLILDHQYN